ncbi:Phage integrase [uncultured Pleomorphomonas sp.]|uniref:Phage integrase n=1 Tax=uncultured Pleomorphomonas sp. TaxID=442121 RepID=A0A212L2E5_9HYPH|nr:recombinase family protein [uncultured Pleomorphomonas sp.]SCM71698.1 Phage integrase [uncultured Pleomorphomonas sp.]
MSRRAVCYSRFSTDLQNERSIEDQEALVRRYCQLHDLKLVELYSDAAQSGASLFGREGLLELLSDAKAAKFDCVVVEELDRLSRDMEDLAGIHKRLTFAGIDIIAVHEGTASTVTVGLRGLVGQLYREDNSRKVRRGLQGLVREGRSAGGKPYGYKADPANKGRLLLMEEEAAVVRRIFEDYAAGKSPRSIARELQIEHAPVPRGGASWSANTIYGWAVRGSGILRNHLYAGQLVWNKVRMVKDPDTGRRVSRPNPPSEWQITDVPEYQIVPTELFDRVQEMIAPRARTRKEVGSMRRPVRLLSGLLRCGSCGAGMSTKGKDKSGRYRIECSRQRDTGSCPNPQTFYLDRVEQAVVNVLRKELKHPKLLVEYVQAYNEARVEYASKLQKKRSVLEKRVRDLDAECERLISFIAKGVGNTDRLGAQYQLRCDELDAAKLELSREPEPLTAVTLHPAALKAYAEDLERLSEAMNSRLSAGYTEISRLLRELVHSVVVRRGKEPGEIEITLNGKLRSLLAQPLVKSGVGGVVVAAGGIEPPTYGL